LSLAHNYKFKRIPLDQITISEANVRSEANARIGLDELKASIRELGLLQPVVILQVGENSYELIIGQRRFLAVSELDKERVKGFDKIDAKIYPKGTDMTEARIASISENLQQRPLLEEDKEKGTTILLKQLGKASEVARRLGCDIRKVGAWLDYEAIVPKSIRKYVDVYISRDYAKQIVAATYPDVERAEAMIKELIRRGLAKNALIRQKLLMIARRDEKLSVKKAVIQATRKAHDVNIRFILSGYYANDIKRASEEKLGHSTKQAINETAQSVVQDWIDERYDRRAR